MYPSYPGAQTRQADTDVLPVKRVREKKEDSKPLPVDIPMGQDMQEDEFAGE